MDEKLTAGRVGLDPHAVAESQRIALSRKLEAFRDDPNSSVLEFSATLDSTERKFLHHLCKTLGLASKSEGKGSDRKITIKKIENANDGENLSGCALPLPTGNAANAMSAYFHQHAPRDEEWSALRKLAMEDGGMHTASDLASSTMVSALLSSRDGSRVTAPTPQELEHRASLHRTAQTRKQARKAYARMMDMRMKLPAWNHCEKIMEQVEKSQVVLVSGDTGCGKSTQVPQFLLDSASMGPHCKMACTQPRRISAIAVAERIAEERCEEIGTTVGYSIRLESQQSESTQLIFMTPGVLLKKLNSDPQLLQFTHIIIDEVHERDRNSEFLLIVLRDLLKVRRDLKIILMSATLQQNKYSDYFGGCPITSIGAHTFPVQEFYLEDALQQTRYLERIGISTSTATDASALLGKNGSRASETFSCALCARGGFKSAEELRTHAALCFGRDGMDPSISELDMNRLMGVVVEEEAAVTAEDVLPEDVNAASANPAEESDESGDETDGESSDDGRAVAAIQSWDGTGGFNLAHSMSAKQAALLLQKYQFSFDDEQVDCELIAQLLEYISESAYEEGAVLVFLPGWDDISRLGDCLRKLPYFAREGKFMILPLHSGVPTKMQREVFKRPPPGCRKIILSTNIAETSITIDDIAFVIDSGRAKEQNYDPHLKLRTLSAQWISKASARQRTGRAGRTRAGVCFHLFSRTRHSSLAEYQESELLRTPLEDISLQAKMFGITTGPPGATASFLSKAVDPPHPLAVANAVELLVDIGAFTPSEELTDLGVRLAGLSIEPQVGKMLLWAYLLGCANSALKVGCAMTYKDPFVLPMGPVQKKQATAAKLSLAKESQSDLIALLFALEGFEGARARGAGSAYGFADRHFLSGSTLSMISDIVKQLSRELTSIGMPNPAAGGDWNAHVRDLSLVGSVLCAGLYPNVASRREKATYFRTLGGTKAKIHLGSVNAIKGKSNFASPCKAEEEYVAFYELIRSSQLFVMSNTTPVSPMALLLLCGNVQVEEKDEGGEEAADDGVVSTLVFVLDNWVKLEAPRALGEQLLCLRHRLHGLFGRYVQKPSAHLTRLDYDTIKTVVALLHDPTLMTASKARQNPHQHQHRHQPPAGGRSLRGRGDSSSLRGRGSGGRGRAPSGAGSSSSSGRGRGGGVSSTARGGRAPVTRLLQRPPK